ncbi:MAG: P-type conjugative transfer protein TrbL, partial [Labrys sp. (in: a-proteobacteria)]
ARAAGSAIASPLRAAGRSMGDSYAAGRAAATGGSPSASAPAASDGPPAWAKRMKRAQSMSHGVSTVAHAVRSGDGGGSGTSIRVSEER